MSENLEVGSIVEGKVVKIKPFGAIVALESGPQGLVHISQIANSFVQNISDHLNIGDTVKVKVLSVDAANGKISLSIRDALPPAPKPAPRFSQGFKPREQKSSYEGRGYSRNAENREQVQSPVNDFEEKMKEWLKQANERQAGLNKRANRR